MAKEIRQKLNEPFDVTYTIRFSGITISDGEMTVTSQMIRDKIIAVLEKLIYEGAIKDFTINLTREELSEAKMTVSKAKRAKEQRETETE